jgi:hypothetical protein
VVRVGSPHRARPPFVPRRLLESRRRRRQAAAATGGGPGGARGTVELWGSLGPARSSFLHAQRWSSEGLWTIRRASLAKVTPPGPSPARSESLPPARLSARAHARDVRCSRQLPAPTGGDLDVKKNRALTRT